MAQPTSDLIDPYCTKDWADAFFSRYVFDEYWSNASEVKKVSALCAATDFIDLYVQFFDDKNQKVTYKHSGDFTQEDPDDYENEINPRNLKQACAQEAAYLLSLDDNPAEPNPLTTMGLETADTMKFNSNMVPSIFSKQAVRLLVNMNGEIDPAATGNIPAKFFQRKVT